MSDSGTAGKCVPINFVDPPPSIITSATSFPVQVNLGKVDPHNPNDPCGIAGTTITLSLIPSTTGNSYSPTSITPTKLNGEWVANANVTITVVPSGGNLTMHGMSSSAPGAYAATSAIPVSAPPSPDAT